MDPEIQKQLEAMSQRIEEIYVSVEKTRKYFQWTLIITVATIVIPLIGIAIAIPYVFSVYSSALNGLM
ncbi:MAG: hypothetical protein PHF35_04840 [Candidatus Moranbacteria bacterium]|nr:hypothetical protein [Candidatus Moranbacteria bacterium]